MRCFKKLFKVIFFFKFITKNNPKIKKIITERVVPFPFPKKDPIYIKIKIINEDRNLK